MPSVCSIHPITRVAKAYGTATVLPDKSSQLS